MINGPDLWIAARVEKKRNTSRKVPSVHQQFLTVQSLALTGNWHKKVTIRHVFHANALLQACLL